MVRGLCRVPLPLVPLFVLPLSFTRATLYHLIAFCGGTKPNSLLIFLRAESQTFLRVKRPSGEERGETDVFAGYLLAIGFFPFFLVTIPEVIAKLNSAQTPRLSKASRKIAYNTKHHHACSTVYCYMAMVLRK